MEPETDLIEIELIGGPHDGLITEVEELLDQIRYGSAAYVRYGEANTRRPCYLWIKDGDR